MQEQFLGEEKAGLLLDPHEFAPGQRELDLDRDVLYEEGQPASGGDSKWWAGQRDGVTV